MAVGQHQWYHFGVGAPPILDYFSGDWDVRWGYGVLTHGHTYIFIVSQGAASTIRRRRWLSAWKCFAELSATRWQATSAASLLGVQYLGLSQPWGRSSPKEETGIWAARFRIDPPQVRNFAG